MEAKRLGCGYTAGVAMLVIAALCAYSGGSPYSTTVLGIVGLGIVATGLCVAHADKRRKRRELQSAEEERNAYLEQEQARMRSELGRISASVAGAILVMRKAISSANRALDTAEGEFEEGVFVPFWDAVESALGHLTRYDAAVASVANDTALFSDVAKGLHSRPPPFLPEDAGIPDATAIVVRLRAIVRKAQKIPDFAKIYQMRLMDSHIVAGFTNIGSALENMGSRIEVSIAGLAEALDNSISSMSRQNAEHHREALAAMESMRDQVASDAEAQREQFDAKSADDRESQGKVEGALDHIQRRKRPYIEHYRDGQY